MDSKFHVFLEVANSLNKELRLVPVLYGSLALSKLVDYPGKVDDVDILVPGEYIKKKWNQLLKLMNRLGFELIDEHEHEFQRSKDVIAFGEEEDLFPFAGIDYKTLQIKNSTNGG